LEPGETVAEDQGETQASRAASVADGSIEAGGKGIETRPTIEGVGVVGEPLDKGEGHDSTRSGVVEAGKETETAGAGGLAVDP
jgi:hypothetical protein